ncbi:MAG: hypothetical protein WCS99_18010 [Limisphaerales bacterium]
MPQPAVQHPGDTGVVATAATPAASSGWQKTPSANVARHVPSGVYSARIRVGGKLIRRKLKIDVPGIDNQI